jgi:hypothetical protein
MKATTSPNRSRSRAGTRERTPLRARTLAGADYSVDAITAARDLAWAGQHASAIDVATAALAAGAGEDGPRLGLLELRAESLSAQGEVDRALADAETMVAIAERGASPGAGSAGVELSRSRPGFLRGIRCRSRDC